MTRGADPTIMVAMLTRTVALSLALLSLAACSTDGGAGSRGSAADDSFVLPGASDTKSIAPPTSRSITGALTFDDIEGGCSYVQTADGAKFEVIYPEGWTLDKAAAILRAPDGTVVRAGETLTIEGAVARDRSSICQVGPIFQASSVTVGPR